MTENFEPEMSEGVPIVYPVPPSDTIEVANMVNHQVSTSRGVGADIYMVDEAADLAGAMARVPDESDAELSSIAPTASATIGLRNLIDEITRTTDQLQLEEMRLQQRIDDRPVALSIGHVEFPSSFFTTIPVAENANRIVNANRNLSQNYDADQDFVPTQRGRDTNYYYDPLLDVLPQRFALYPGDHLEMPATTTPVTPTIAIPNNADTPAPICKSPYPCCICMYNVPACIAYPCGHYTYCFECARKLFHDKSAGTVPCPLCKTPVKDVIKVHV